MFEKNQKIKFSYSMEDFLEKANEYIEKMKGKTKELAIYAAEVFSNAAAKMTPPMKGQNGSLTIPKERYSRPYLFLPDLVGGKISGFHAKAEDYAAIKSGYLFKVLNTKHYKARKNILFAYCKTKSELKRLVKIDYRGLAKVSWGSNIDSIGAKIPLGIQRLMRKSPKLQEHKYNEVSLDSSDNGLKYETTIINTSENIERFGGHAKKSALTRTMKALTTRIAFEAKEKVEL